MNQNRSERTMIVLFIVIIAGSFLFWVSGLYLFGRLLQSYGFPINILALIEALSTAVTAAAVLGAGYIAYRELSEIASSRHMEVADRLFTELNSSDNIEARRWVFKNLPDNPEVGLASLTSDGQSAIKQVLNSLDRVAFLTQNNWINDDIVMPWMHPMIAKSWEKLEAYVTYERQRRNEPYYYEHAEKLAERTRLWRASRSIKESTTWVEDAL